MTLKRYLIIMTSFSAICWGIWIYVLYIVNPEITNWIGFALFYISLFLSLVGASALVGFLVRFVALKRGLAWRLVKEAFRQSFLFSLLVVVSLYLLAHGLFSWFNLFLLVAALSIIEFFILSYSKDIKNNQY